MPICKIVIVVFSFLLASCATYKIEQEATGREAGAIKPVGYNATITVRKDHNWSEGFQCFEPMLYVLTIGIIPTHCIDTYSVSGVSGSDGEANEETLKYRVTSIQGWAALLIAPLPNWRYGYINGVEEEIIEMAKHSGK